jgi:hypothetical protein
LYFVCQRKSNIASARIDPNCGSSFPDATKRVTASQNGAIGCDATPAGAFGS